MSNRKDINSPLNSIPDPSSSILKDKSYTQQNSPYIVKNDSNNYYTNSKEIQNASKLNEFISEKKIQIMDNQINDAYFIDLIKNIYTYNDIESFEVKGTQITGYGCSYLGEYIANSLSLKVCRISNNHISDNDQGLHAFFPAIAMSPSLIEVDLSSNKLGNTCAFLIGNMLKVNHFLQILNLENNEITNDGAILILNSLSYNRNIKAIILAGNKVDEKLILDIEKKLESNKGQPTKTTSPIKDSKEKASVFKAESQLSPPYVPPREIYESNLERTYPHYGDYESDKVLRDYRYVDTRYRALLSDYEILRKKHEENLFNLPHVDHLKIEIAKLEGIIEKLNAEIILKNERIESLSFELATKHQNELIQLQNEIVKLKNELDLTRKTLMIREDEISKLRYDYDQNLAIYISRIKTLENENARLVNEVERTNEKYRIEIERFHSQILSLEQELEKARNEFQNIDALNKKITIESAERIKEIESQLLYQKDENIRLKQMYYSAIIKIKQLEEYEFKFSKLLDENVKLKTEIKSLDDVCIKREDDFNKAVKEVNDSRATIQNLLSKTNILETESKRFLIDNANLKRDNLNLHTHVETHCNII